MAGPKTPKNPKTPEPEPTTPTAPSAPKSAGRRKATVGKEKEPATGIMPQGDVDFLIACLQNTVAGNIQVDLQKIAEARGFTNLGSVRNRMAAIKAKYNIAMIASTKASAAGTGDDEDAAAPAVKTPKGKVTKPKATSAKKATPATRSKKRKAEEELEEEEEVDDDMAVKFPGLEKETKVKETKKAKDLNKKVKESKESKEETEAAVEEAKDDSKEEVKEEADADADTDTDADAEADADADAGADVDTIKLDENA